MSTVPRPHSTSPVGPSTRRVGRLTGSAVSGTVSMWPASTTRSARPRAVRATTVLPTRVTCEVRRARAARPRRHPRAARSSEAHRLDVADRGGERGDVGRRGRARVRWYGIRLTLVTAPTRSDVHRAVPGRLRGHRRLDGMTRTAWGHGLLTLTDDGTVLDAWFPSPALGEPGGAGELAAPAGLEAPRRARTPRAACAARSASSPPTSTPRPPTPPTAGCGCTCSRTASSRPTRVNLDGLFGVLTNVVWTSPGPVRRRRVRADPGADARRAAPVQVFGVDKFPRMTDYVVPSGVRIADADRVRLGAHLASGTTVMHEGFVNFNAGTLGTSMVEGRISQGVVVGDGSDIGGGASTMGTLSGGGTERVSIGERCLLGAESGLGIALGDDCVVEAGLYVTAGTKVTLPDGTVTKARELSGQSQPALPAQLGDRRRRGPPPRRARHRAQLRAARQRLTRPGHRPARRHHRRTPTACRAPPEAPSRSPRRSPAPRRRRRVAGLVTLGLRRRARRGGRTSGSATSSTLVTGERCVVTASGTTFPWAPTRRATPPRSRPSPCSATCRRGPRRSRSRRPCRSARSATCASATATRWGCSSSGPRRAGAPPSRSSTPSTRRTSSTTPSSRSTATRTMDIAEAAQEVQRSAAGEAYAQHEAQARVTASALSGQTPAGIGCALDDPRPPATRRRSRRCSRRTSASRHGGRRPHGHGRRRQRGARVGGRLVGGGPRRRHRRRAGRRRRPGVGALDGGVGPRLGHDRRRDRRPAARHDPPLTARAPRPQLSRPMPEPSPRHGNGSPAKVKVPVPKWRHPTRGGAGQRWATGV